MLAVVLAVLVSAAPAQSAAPAKKPPVITPADAATYVGHAVVVRGKIAQIVLSVNLTTHINFGGAFPNHVFTVKIFKANQSLFPDIRDYDGKVVEVEGVVRMYRGKPEIELTQIPQIRLGE